jgi:hypothetical protein
MSLSLEHRKDIRSEETFGLNIRDYTEREHYWSIALHLDFLYRGLICKLSDNGVDGSGKIIRSKLENYNADKKYTLPSGKNILIEIKTAPEWLDSFFTFKVFCLKECINENSLICVPRIKHYYIFKTKSLEKMLQYNHSIYRGFSPNDKAVRIPMYDIKEMVKNKMVIYREWGPKSYRYIEKNMDILTREKNK